MDADGFDSLARSLDIRSRRGALRSLGALSVVGLVVRLGVPGVEAKKKNKKGGKKDKKNDTKPECPTCTCPTPDSCPGNQLPCDGACVSRERICGNRCCRAGTYCIDALQGFCDCPPGNYDCGAFCCAQGEVCGESACTACPAGAHICAEDRPQVFCGTFNNDSCDCVTSVDGVTGCAFLGSGVHCDLTCTTDADCKGGIYGDKGVCIDFTGNCGGCASDTICVPLGCPPFP
jgi:hypothetical protein